MIFNGKEIDPKSPREAINLGIALVPEDRKRHGAMLGISIKNNINMPIYERNSKFSVINNKQEQEIAEKYMKLLDYAQDDFMGLTYDDGNKAFANGEAAMIINGNWAINQYKNANADINVDMFALPASNEKSQNYVTSGVDVLLGVCKDSANEEVAKEFVSFMLEPENAKMYIDDQFAFSAVKGVEQENETVAGVKEDIAAGKVANFPDHYYPSGFDMSALLTEMCLNYTNGMDNEENINQFLAQCDEKYDIANVD